LSKIDKLILKILKGTSDSNIKFDELINLLEYLGFEKRIRGSHHIFRKEEIQKRINLQKDSNMAKPYQVKQVRKVIVEYQLWELDDEI